MVRHYEEPWFPVLETIVAPNRESSICIQLIRYAGLKLPVSSTGSKQDGYT